MYFSFPKLHPSQLHYQWLEFVITEIKQIHHMLSLLNPHNCFQFIFGYFLNIQLVHKSSHREHAANFDIMPECVQRRALWSSDPAVLSAQKAEEDLEQSCLLWFGYELWNRLPADLRTPHQMRCLSPLRKLDFQRKDVLLYNMAFRAEKTCSWNDLVIKRRQTMRSFYLSIASDIFSYPKFIGRAVNWDDLSLT